jgi:hypothetical protein
MPLWGDKTPSQRFQLYDIGAADLSIERWPPRINNEGLVIANRSSGGFTWEKDKGEFSPDDDDERVRFYAVNDHSDVLASVCSFDKKLEWSIWPRGGNCPKCDRIVLPTGAHKKNFKKMCLNTLSNDRVVAGCFLNHHGERYILRLDKTGVERAGLLQGLTASGQIYGFADKDGDLFPALWENGQSIVSIKNYRSKVIPEGTIRPETLTVAPDGVAYCSYWVEYKDANPIVLGVPKFYYNFAWNPKTGEYKQLDIDGMRVTKVNASHTLIGLLNGKPVVCFPGKKPVELVKLLTPDQRKDWEILQISDINDKNQLVGVGKFRGETHFFFAE